MTQPEQAIPKALRGQPEHRVDEVTPMLRGVRGRPLPPAVESLPAVPPAPAEPLPPHTQAIVDAMAGLSPGDQQRFAGVVVMFARMLRRGRRQIRGRQVAPAALPAPELVEFDLRKIPRELEALTPSHQRRVLERLYAVTKFGEVERSGLYRTRGQAFAAAERVIRAEHPELQFSDGRLWYWADRYRRHGLAGLIRLEDRKRPRSTENG